MKINRDDKRNTEINNIENGAIKTITIKKQNSDDFQWKNIIRKAFICCMAAGMAVMLITGCLRSDSGESTASSPENESAAAMENQPQTEVETEPETESMYNEDGTRRAWVTLEGRLNVRAAADASSDFIGSFHNRQEIRLLSEQAENGFYKVSGTCSRTGKEISGYASQQYISLDMPESPVVKLDVVSYLQTDERWGQVLLGSTKKTMYDIGCATSCLAMSETFIKSEEVLPDEVAAKSIYTRSGEIGWPNDYYWNYNKNGYLEFVFNKLHEGIPVLIGSTRRNGSPHWVLITGYVGDGNVLKAEDFLINDPMPVERTNLQQYINEFPVFKKLIYYCKDRSLVDGSGETQAEPPANQTE